MVFVLPESRLCPSNLAKPAGTAHSSAPVSIRPKVFWLFPVSGLTILMGRSGRYNPSLHNVNGQSLIGISKYAPYLSLAHKKLQDLSRPFSEPSRKPPRGLS